MTNPLKDRDMSGFPVSIGTGLALETLFQPLIPIIDKDREPPKRIDPKTYDQYLFNVETLLRNLLSSTKAEILERCEFKDFYEVLMEEIHFLSFYFKDLGYKASFFFKSYKEVKDKYPDNIRLPITPKQTLEDKIRQFCFDKLSKEKTLLVQILNCKTPYPKIAKTLVLTHIPYDLTEAHLYTRLDLLESHTGVVKTSREFNSKYIAVPREDMSFLPLVESLLIVFGDKVMFKINLQARKEVMEKLKKSTCTPSTSDMSIKLIIK